jgi:nicotinamidase-related amidase
MTEKDTVPGVQGSGTAVVVVNLLVDMIERAKPFPMPPEYTGILERTVSFIRSAREAGYPLIFIQDQHRPDDKEFTDFSVGQPHAVRGSEGAELMPQLLPLGPHDYVVGKRRFSAFFGTDMDLYLREEGICRLAISDCLYSKTGEMHDRAMREFAATLGPVMTGEEFLAASPPGAATSLADRGHLAVLVVNVNKDLVANKLPEDGTRLAGRLENLRELLCMARGRQLPILYAMDAHLSDDWEFRIRKPHGIAGTEGAEIADELAAQPGDPIFYKRSYDAFYETGLDAWLREKGISRLVIVGGPTNVDLRHTVVSAYNNRYRPIVIKDCTDASTEEFVNETLQDMFFCRRMTLDNFSEWIVGR